MTEPHLQRGIMNRYMVIIREKSDILQKISERHTVNDEYENFVTTHIEAAAECLPTKLRAKCRVPWESLVVRKKQDNIKKVSLLSKGARGVMGGARGVMVIVVGIGHGDTSSKPGRD